jgi:predicted transcriptional regulator
MLNLSGALGMRSLEELQRIANLWGVEPPTTTEAASRQRLELAIRDPIAARFVWEQLSDSERRVLFAALGPSARNWAPIEQLPEKTNLDEPSIHRVLARLQRYGLLLQEIARVQGNELSGHHPSYYGYSYARQAGVPAEQKAIVYVPTEIAPVLYTTGREFFLPQHDRSTQSLNEILMPYRQGDLDQIARRFGLTLSSYYSRPELRSLLADNLAQADAVQYALKHLDEAVRDLYEWLCAEGGKVTMAAVRARLGKDHAELSAVIHMLEEFAIAFDTFSNGQRVLFVPAETLENIRRAAARPRPPQELEPRPQPQSTHPADTPFLWDLVLFVGLIYQNDIELTRSGSMPKRAAMKLLPLLTCARAQASLENTQVYLDMLKQEAKDLGLVQVPPASGPNAKPRLVVGTKLDAWANTDLVGQVRRIFRRWPNNRWWVDEFGAGYREWYSYYLDTIAAREVVQRHLAKCQPGVWYSLEQFCQVVQGDDPFVLRPAQRFAGDTGYKMADELRANWPMTDGEVIAGIFRSTLAELGIVALGYDRPVLPQPGEAVNPDAFMVTELGAAVIHGNCPVQTTGPRVPLLVQPNFDVIVMEADMAALYRLIRFAAPVQIGRVSRFSITKDTLLRGLAQGLSLDEVLAFLQAGSQKPVPQNVIYTLRDWSRQYKEATISTVTLVEVADADLADELCRTGRLANLGLRRLGPCAIALPGTITMREVQRLLEKIGYATKLNGMVETASATANPRR